MPQLRLNKITTITAANEYLKAHYLPAHNKKFALPIENNAHRKLPDNANIDDYSYQVVTRKVANDWTVKYKAKTYQILRKNYYPAKSTVYVKKTFTGKIIIIFREQEERL